MATATTKVASRPGYWSTRGGRIIDQNGRTVLFSGVSWPGFDSPTAVVHGLWSRTLPSMVAQMAACGFNLIRLPFAGNILRGATVPLSINYYLNPTLKGLNSLTVMDKVIAAAGSKGIRVILDYHRMNPGSAPEGGLWYDAASPEKKWIANWRALAARYARNPIVVGVDLFNEVHGGSHPGPFWSPDGHNEPYNWRTAAKRAADAIQAVNPNLLICVEGMFQGTWWSGNLQAVARYPLVLKVPHKLVYSVHDYGILVSDQAWFHAPSFPRNLPAMWDRNWGFVQQRGIAPVWLGEFGSKLPPATTPAGRIEAAWLAALVAYARANHVAWTYWDWGPNSADTGGILEDDWTTVRRDKMRALSAIMHPSFV